MTEMPVDAMSEDAFWKLVAGNPGEDELKKRLSGLDLDDLVAFGRTQLALIHRAFRWDLWGAADVIEGGCSDDCFDDFRQWLVMQGRDTYTTALRNPDTLAAVISQPEIISAFGHLPATIFEERDRDVGEYYDRLYKDLGGSSEPIGEPRDSSSYLAHYPKLCAQFGWESESGEG